MFSHYHTKHMRGLLNVAHALARFNINDWKKDPDVVQLVERQLCRTNHGTFSGLLNSLFSTVCCVLRAMGAPPGPKPNKRALYFTTW